MDIKQLVNIEIVKTLVRSSKKCVTAKEAMCRIEKFKNAGEKSISLATVYRIFDELIKIGECKKVSGGYISAKDNRKYDINEIINNKRNNIVLRCFYAIIAVLSESEKPLTAREISKIINKKYNIPDDVRRVKNIIDEVSCIFEIYEDDDGKLMMNKNKYLLL